MSAASDAKGLHQVRQGDAAEPSQFRQCRRPVGFALFDPVRETQRFGLFLQSERLLLAHAPEVLRAPSHVFGEPPVDLLEKLGLGRRQLGCVAAVTEREHFAHELLKLDRVELLHGPEQVPTGHMGFNRDGGHESLSSGSEKVHLRLFYLGVGEGKGRRRGLEEQSLRQPGDQS
jgi:hypothetical protein